MDSIVTAVDVRRRYGEGDAAVNALAGVTVGFERGRFSAIMGPSGSGKSTLMHILAGLDRPTSGSVTLDGDEISGLDDAELTKLRRDKLGFVFQFFNLIPVLTAEENVLLPLSIAGRKPDAEWFERLPSCRVASSSGWRWRARWRHARPSCSRTSPPATSIPRRARRFSGCCARP
jgi:putative ABC transport system ATP-binding protein